MNTNESWNVPREAESSQASTMRSNADGSLVRTQEENVLTVLLLRVNRDGMRARMSPWFSPWSVVQSKESCNEMNERGLSNRWMDRDICTFFSAIKHLVLV